MKFLKFFILFSFISLSMVIPRVSAQIKEGTNYTQKTTTTNVTDSLVEEWNSRADSLTNNEILSYISNMLDSNTIWYNSFLETLEITWSPPPPHLNEFSEEYRLYKNHFLEILGILYKYHKKNGSIQLTWAYEKCIKDGLKRIGNSELANGKVFNILVDYFTLYREMETFYKEPSGTNRDILDLISDFKKRKLKIVTQLEIFLD